MSGEEEKGKVETPADDIEKGERPTSTTPVDVEKGEGPPSTTEVDVEKGERPPSTTEVEVEKGERPPSTTPVDAEKGERPPSTTPVDVEKGVRPPSTTPVDIEKGEKPMACSTTEVETKDKQETEADETQPPADLDEAAKFPNSEDDQPTAVAVTDGLLDKDSAADKVSSTNNSRAIPPPAIDASEDCKMANGSFVQQDKDYDKPQTQKQKLMRYIRRKEVVLCTLGCVTFVAGIILIVVAVLTMKSGCELPAEENLFDDEPVGDSPDESHGKVNLAEGKPAFQSTSEYSQDGGFYNASLATDKIHGHILTENGCAQTLMEARPYWYVDLGRQDRVKKVEIVGGTCCVGELHNFEVRVGPNEDLSENHLCREHLGTALKLAITIHCHKPVYGRYVSIQSLGDAARPKNRLTLCDVMVYAG